MKAENECCPNCDKLINKEDHISIGGECYCDEVCFEEWMYKTYGKKWNDETLPFLK